MTSCHRQSVRSFEEFRNQNSLKNSAEKQEEDDVGRGRNFLGDATYSYYPKSIGSERKNLNHTKQ